MAKTLKQAEAAGYIDQLLIGRGLNIPSRLLGIDESQRWIVYENGERQLGLDPATGVWVRRNPQEAWRCIGTPCTVSSALQAIEVLTGEQD